MIVMVVVALTGKASDEHKTNVTKITEIIEKILFFIEKIPLIC